MDVETVEPVPKKKMLSRLEEQRAARVKVAAGGDGGSGGAGRQAPVTGRRVLISERCWCTWLRRTKWTWMTLTFWVFGIGGAPTACARRRARSRLRRKCRIWRLSLGCTMGSRPPAIRPSEMFQRSPTSLLTCAVPCLHIKSSA